jgi:hypothetical protein
MRLTTIRNVLAILSLLLTAMFAGVFAARAQVQKPDELKRMMTEKLKHSQVLLGGLAEEDFPLIRDRARELRNIGEASLKQVSQNLTYVKYCAEFVSIAEELERRAKEEDLNGVTLSYIRLTVNCVECHKFTRDNRILDQRAKVK